MTSSIGVVGGTMGDLSMDGGASVGGRVELVFPITPIRMSSNVQEVVLA